MTALRLLAVGAVLSACASTGRTAAPSPTPVPSVVPTPSATAHPTARPSAVVTAAPAVWAVRLVGAADLPHSWHAGCPVGPAQLRRVTVAYVGFDGLRHTGALVVRAGAVADVLHVFRSLYSQRFPIRSIRPVDVYGGSDDASMAADNTSAFNCRQAVGGSGWSQHAYGLAIDVNPRENPYVLDGQVLPPEGAGFVDRTQHVKGTAEGVLVRAFAAVGWGWGGRFSSPDYQHFSSNGK